MSDHKAKQAARLDEALELATGHARTELGTEDNKEVTATATLTVSSTDEAGTETSGVKAGVTLGVSHTPKEAKAKK